MVVDKRSPLRVGLDARFSGPGGGVQQAVLGLSWGLSQLTDGDEEYVFLTLAGREHWLRPYLNGGCRTLACAAPPVRRRLRRRVASALPWAQTLWRDLKAALGKPAISLARWEGVLESAGIKVMHFTRQDGFLTGVPSLYEPYDLLHVHFPEFFSREERREREEGYRLLCHRASRVVAMNSRVKEDLVRHFGLPEEKVVVVPRAPILEVLPTPSAQELENVRSKYGLPWRFAFYPAQTWPHKNHIGLLEALALLRDRYALSVPLVSCGQQTSFFRKIQRRVRDLRLEGQVSFLGHVSTTELYALYKLADCLVMPSFFEGWGMPVLEAFAAGVPVACSEVTVLPALCAGAARHFDPRDVEQMAQVIGELWTHPSLREELARRGAARARCFSWKRTAAIFRAHYRKTAGCPTSEEDEALIWEPPVL